MFVAGPPVVNRLSAKAVRQAGTRRLGDPATGQRRSTRRRTPRTKPSPLTRRFLSYLPSSVHDARRARRRPTDPARREESLVRGTDPARHPESLQDPPDRREVRRRGQLLRDGQEAVRPLGRDRLCAHRRLARRGDGERPDVLRRRLDGRCVPEGGALCRHGRDVSSPRGLFLRLPGLPDRPGGREGRASSRQGVRTMSAGCSRPLLPWCTFIIRNAFPAWREPLCTRTARGSTGAMRLAVGSLGFPASGGRHRGGIPRRSRRCPDRKASR